MSRAAAQVLNQLGLPTAAEQCSQVESYCDRRGVLIEFQAVNVGGLDVHETRRIDAEKC